MRVISQLEALEALSILLSSGLIERSFPQWYSYLSHDNRTQSSRFSNNVNSNTATFFMTVLQNTWFRKPLNKTITAPSNQYGFSLIRLKRTPDYVFTGSIQEL